MTIPYAWQRQFNASDIEVVPRIDNPIPDGVVDAARTTTSPTSAEPTTPTG